MDLTFDEQRHRYSLGDRVCAPVTSVIRDMGLATEWKFTAEDRLRGQAIHVASGYIDEGFHPTMNPDGQWDRNQTDPALHGFLAGYIRFLKETGFRAIRSEVRVYSARYLVAGTLDKEGAINGRHCILDLKSGTVPKGVAIQLAGYEELGRECKEITTSDPILRLSVRLPREGKPQLDDWSDSVWLYRWRSLVDLYNLRKAWGYLPKRNNE